MKEETVLESSVTVLRTPLGDIEIVDEDEKNIAFDIVDRIIRPYTTMRFR